LVNPFFKIERALDIRSEGRFRKAITVVNGFAYDVIRKRRVEIEDAHNAGKEFEKEDLLSKFMGHHSGAEDRYSDKELRDVIVDFLLAGRDTTAVTMTWFTYEMCLHPEIADKIYQEGVEVVGEHTKFETMAELLTHENLGKMQYLQAVLSESLRLHPPVPKTTKEVLADDVLPGGIAVKKGDAVQYITYSMSRMPFIWGSDALEMKPERWLKNGVYQSVSTFQFSVFQGGPRICLGRDSAYLQLKVTLALLTHFFIFRLVPGHEIEYDSTFVMPMKNGLKVTLSPRH
jgi:cytochrome P450